MPPYFDDGKMPAPLNRRQRGSGCCKAPTRISLKQRIEWYGKQRRRFIRLHALNCWVSRRHVEVGRPNVHGRDTSPPPHGRFCAAGGRRADRTIRSTRRRPARLYGDKGLRLPSCRRLLRVPRHHSQDRSALGRVPHAARSLLLEVEWSLAWLANRRLAVRYERRPDIPTTFLHLACAMLRPR